MKIKKFLLLSLLVTGSVFLITSAVSHAAVSPDAVAIRVLPNPYWLSSSKWYAAQGYTGSPQTTIVDGYDAIRDNRTVYVAALNMSDSPNSIGVCSGDNSMSCDLSGNQMAQDAQCYKKIYGDCVLTGNPSDPNNGKCSKSAAVCSTNAWFDCGVQYGHCEASPVKKSFVFSNIYVITYNEGADNNTVDIFGKILSAWKFNTNMNGLGTCFSADPSVAVATTTVGCKFDTDCPSQTFCDSDRAKLARDQKRITTFFALRDALNNYKNTSGHFPLLESGSYLKNATISTWPSWNGVFLPQLGVSASDPINTLGDCPGYDKGTCWNPSTYKYYASTTAANLKLPASSSAIVYSVNQAGTYYNLCFNREFSFTAAGGDIDTVTAINTIKSCNTDKVGAGAANLAPRFDSATNFTVKTGDKLLGYIKISDPENDPINFSFSKTPTQLATYPNISILSTNDPKQLKIIANSVYNTPNSPVVGTLTISDTAGNSTSADIKVDFSAVASKPVITAPDVDYYLSAKPENAFNYTATIEAPANSFSSVGLSAPNFGVSTVVGLEHDFPVNVYLQGLKYKVENIGTDQASGLNQYQFRIYGNIVSNSLNTPAVDNDKKYTITVGTVTKDFTIHFHANAPQLAMQCNKQSAIYNTFKCQIVNNNLSNKIIYYFSTPYPQFKVSPLGLVTSSIKILTPTPFTIIANNEYGATSSVSSVASDVTGFHYSCGMVKFDGGPWDLNGNARNQEGYYRTIKLGDRCWLADNLNVASGVCYNGSNINCSAYGALYDGANVSDSMCPAGWHIPNNNDFNALLDAVDGNGSILGIKGNSGLAINYAGYHNSGAGSDSSVDLLINGYYWSSNITYIPPSQHIGSVYYSDAKRNQFTFSSSSNAVSSAYSLYRRDGSNSSYSSAQYSVRCVQDLSCDLSCSTGEYCDKYSGTCKSQCGDGVVESGEVCDNGSLDNAGLNGVGVYSPLSNPFNPNGFCNATCSGYTTHCGDNVKQAIEGEICDGVDGVATSPADSSPAKRYSCGNDCKFSATAGYCGDGIVNGVEGCDDKDSYNASGIRQNDGLKPACKDCAWTPVYMAGQISAIVSGNAKPLSGITISLTKSDGTIYSATTDANGKYSIGSAATPTITSGAPLKLRINLDKNNARINGSYGAVTQDDMTLYADNPSGNFILMSSVNDGKYVFIATWLNEADLDSHLSMSSLSGTGYGSIDYVNKTYTGNGQNASLDYDSTVGSASSPRYEVISFSPVVGTNFKYWLLDYHNGNLDVSAHITLYKPSTANSYTHEFVNEWRAGTCSDGNGDCNNKSDCAGASSGVVCNAPSPMTSITWPANGVSF